jgi:glycosyltransferase involved in cell wall biosynthesis
MPHSKIKVLFHSNYSRLLTGFGKNMRNILLALHDDPDIEVVEAANGVPFGADVKTPWKTYGTAPVDHNLLQEINSDGHKQRMASYGFYCIDQIIEDCKPDIYVGIEDIWAFRDYDKKPWWNKTKKIIWTTLDSLPILDDAFHMTPKCDEFLVWASFAEKEMRSKGFDNVKTVHGAIDYSNFYKLENKHEIRKKFNIDDCYVIGFVFKNQLRKSLPNLLDGFKLFKQKNPNIKTKLLLQTDWSEKTHGWDLVRYIKEKEIDNTDILAPYVCQKCKNYLLHPYEGEKKNCPYCGTKESVITKTNNFGLSERQLNELYNCMDVYCHPFTSGGQELPIQEAKACELITLVTEYSCGTDSCYPEQGGLPLKWYEYREPHTQFIKATTCPISISEQLEYVYNLNEDEKNKLIKNALTCVNEKFSIDKTVKDLKNILLNCKNKSSVEEKQENIGSQNNSVSFNDLLDKEPEDRILFVMPESAGDVFMATSLLPSMKEAYPNKDIYFATKPEFFEILDGNKFIYKVLAYNPSMENLPLMEGIREHRGYFQVCFLPHIGTQRILDYLHQGNKDQIMFDIKSKNFNTYAFN